MRGMQYVRVQWRGDGSAAKIELMLQQCQARCAPIDVTLFDALTSRHVTFTFV